jgi:hypothetical protein
MTGESMYEEENQIKETSRMRLLAGALKKWEAAGFYLFLVITEWEAK